MTGIGPVAVRQPRVRDREAIEGARIRYSPSILPRYARRSQSLEVLIPILYLKGISTGDFEEALAALVGKDAPGLSRRPSPASRRCGARSMRAGRSAICQPSATSIAGPMASIWRLGSRSRRSAFWSSSARRLKAGRSLSASPSFYGLCGRRIHPTLWAGDCSVSSRICGYGERRRGHRVERTRRRSRHEGMHRSAR
jgi:hypothetical protein